MTRLLLTVAAALLLTASAAHAGVALETYTPGTADYSATTLPLNTTVVASESGAFESAKGQWFSFTMPHNASLTGITIPIHITSRTSSSATINFGFWLGNDPASSTFGGITLPAASIVVGQTHEYELNFPAGYLLAAGQRVTIDIMPVGATGFGNGMSGHIFLSDDAGTTRERSLGVIFGPSQPFYPAIQLRDNAAPIPEPASLSLLALGALPLLRRRR